MGLWFRKRFFLPEKSIFSLAQINLFTSIAAAATTTIWAVYINSFVDNQVLTGLISGFLTFVSFLSYFFFVPLIERNDRRKLFAFSLSLFVIVYFLLAYVKNFFLFLLLAILLTANYAFKVSLSGVIIKNNSSDKTLSRCEGILYTFLNLGWIIGPLVAGYVTVQYGMTYVFLIASILILFALLIFKTTKFKDGSSSAVQRDYSLYKSFKGFFSKRKRVYAYVLGGGHTIWWVLIYLYMPLFLIERGYSEMVVGYFLTAIVIPLILLEFRLSSLVEKYGFKKMFKIGFMITTLASLSCFIFYDIHFIFVFLVLASFGLAILEPSSEAYFLKISNAEEVKKYFGPYNTSRDLFQFIGKMAGSLVLLFLPFRFLFLFFGLFAFMMFILSSRLKHID
jgi:ACDE family multidrug resistance protein